MDGLDKLKQNLEQQDESVKESNPLIDKLLSSIHWPWWKWNEHKEKQATLQAMHKVISVRYKVYTVLIVICARYLRWNFLQPQIQKYKSLVSEIQASEMRELQLKGTLENYKKSQEYINLINEQQNSTAIYKCINDTIWCDNLDPQIKENLEVVKAYLQIGNLYDDKMIIDEKSLLINLDAFMTKKWRNGFPTDQSNGDIYAIDIGEPKQIDQQLYKVPVQVSIKFLDKNWLLWFVDNIENRIIKWIDAKVVRSTPVWYLIEEISYDIVKYQEEQEVKVEMTAYYYQEIREEGQAGWENAIGGESPLGQPTSSLSIIPATWSMQDQPPDSTLDIKQATWEDLPSTQEDPGLPSASYVWTESE